MCRLNPLCRESRCLCAKFDEALREDGLGHLDTAHRLEVPEEGRSEPAIGVSSRGGGRPKNGEETVRNRDDGAELHDEAQDILRGYRFKNSAEREIWRLHASGIGFHSIAARCNGVGFSRVRRIVMEITNEWRKRQRRPVTLTRARIAATDPALLLKLLEVL